VLQWGLLVALPILLSCNDFRDGRRNDILRPARGDHQLSRMYLPRSGGAEPFSESFSKAFAPVELQLPEEWVGVPRCYLALHVITDSRRSLMRHACTRNSRARREFGRVEHLYVTSNYRLLPIIAEHRHLRPFEPQDTRSFMSLASRWSCADAHLQAGVSP